MLLRCCAAIVRTATSPMISIARWSWCGAATRSAPM